MRFYFFTKGDKNVPSSRYRAYYIAETLVSMGYETHVMPASDRGLRSFYKYLRILMQITPDDTLYLQRTVYNKYFLGALLIARLCGRHFVFDIDDAVYEHSRLKTELLTRLADFVTCGSGKIQEWTIKRNKKSFVLTNGMPLSVYTERQVAPNGIPIVGWIGTMPEIFMKSAIEGLLELASTGRVFELKVIGAMGNPEIRKLLKNVPNLTIIESLNWADPSEAVQEIKTFTVGLMPLSTSEWDQVKYFKALEYMACGVPVVGSPGVTVREIIEKFQCGLIAENTSQWVEKISALLDDASMGTQMGSRGRAGVVSTYSIDAVTQELLRYIEQNKSKILSKR